MPFVRHRLARGAAMIACAIAAASCAGAHECPPGSVQGVSVSLAASKADVETLLDRFHAGAAAADEKAYFDCLLDESVFLGTDATERWNKAAFRAYAHPHFAKGKGWTYRPTTRHVNVLATGDVATFDELLAHEKYGTMRGSGVAVRRDGRWYVLQYDLHKPIPNDRFEAAVRAAGEPPPPPYKQPEAPPAPGGDPPIL